MNNKISIIGMGYVGCANGLMFSKKFNVSMMDIDQKKVRDFNNNKLPIHDTFAQQYFENENDNLNIHATTDLLESINESSFVLLCLPTNFDKSSNQFDTTAIEKTVNTIISENQDTTIIIKSTVNIGYTASLQKKFSTSRIIFSPEFLREGHALEDNFFPSRIIIGDENPNSKLFGELLLSVIHVDDVPVLYMQSTAAESVKLFSNTYLAMRVAFFNELDSFCFDNNIDTKNVIDGVSADKRIGNFYNNPSFGFGGYCLPKDSKQLLHRFGDTHHNLIKAIQDSNLARINSFTDIIMSSSPNIIGIYKLEMKEGINNSRGSSMYKIIESLSSKKVKILVYDPTIQELDIVGANLIQSFNDFASQSDIIITNRLDEKIKVFSNKIFTRDVFSSDE